MKRSKRDYRSRIARAGSVLIATPDRVKYSESEPRDDAGRWTAEAGNETPQAVSGRFTQSYSNAKISADHRAYWTGGGTGHFAQGYVAYSKGDSGSPREQKLGEAFHNAFTKVSERSGFVGSGEAFYRNNQTGAVFHVERMANGKGFWGTDHSITELPPGTDIPTLKYDPSEARDPGGRWTAGGADAVHGDYSGYGSPHEEAQAAIELHLNAAHGHHGNAMDAIQRDPNISSEAKGIAYETLGPHIGSSSFGQAHEGATVAAQYYGEDDQQHNVTGYVSGFENDGHTMNVETNDGRSVSIPDHAIDPSVPPIVLRHS